MLSGSVRDISRDDRARIATCSLRTATYSFKANYSVDDTTLLSTTAKRKTTTDLDPDLEYINNSIIYGAGTLKLLNSLKILITYRAAAILNLRKLKKVAQGCRLGNQADFVPRPNMNTNQQKNSILENISGSENWLYYGFRITNECLHFSRFRNTGFSDCRTFSFELQDFFSYWRTFGLNNLRTSRTFGITYEVEPFDS